MQEITIKDIDTLIEKADEYNSAKKFLSELADLIIPYLKISANEKSDYKQLMNREIEHSKKRFIAFCLLRVYSKNYKLITDISVKHNIHQLFEKAIPEIYKTLSITNKSETYDIENKLRGFVKNIETNISAKITTNIDLSLISVFENSYLSAINNNTNKSILNSFWGQKDKQLFDKIFKTIKQYNEEEFSQKIDLFNKAIDLLDAIIDNSKETGTKYSLNYINAPFSKIRELLIENFKNNPFTKPAKLILKRTEKKHPISKGVKYKLQLLIENDSTGFAKDTKIEITDYTEDIKISNTSQYIGEIKNSSIIEFEYEGREYSDSILLFGFIEWTNFNEEKCKEDFNIELFWTKNKY